MCMRVADDPWIPLAAMALALVERGPGETSLARHP